MTNTATTSRRNRSIAEIYLAGRFYQADIAKSFGVSRERIRQILVKTCGQDTINNIKYKRMTDRKMKLADGWNRSRVRKYLKKLVEEGLLWNQNYPACIECGTTDKKYGGHGLCGTCYGRWLYHYSEDRKQKGKMYTLRWQKNHPNK